MDDLDRDKLTPIGAPTYREQLAFVFLVVMAGIGMFAVVIGIIHLVTDHLQWRY